MAIEDAADLAAYFDPDLGAVPAQFTPSGGSASAVTVIVSRADETSDVGFNGIEQFDTKITVRASEMPAEPDDGIFASAIDPDTGTDLLGGLTYRVVESDLDETGSIWVCKCQPTS